MTSVPKSKATSKKVAERAGIKRPSPWDKAVLHRCELKRIDSLLARVAARIGAQDIDAARQLIANAMRAAS